MAEAIEDRIWDVAIVGGAAVGAAVAFWLARAGGVSVLVLERDPSYARASTTRSAASIRQQFSTPVNIALSRFGVGFIRDFPELTGGADLGLRENGYLICASAAGRDALAGMVAVQAGEGAGTALLDAGDLAARFPWLNAGDLACASLGMRDEGWFDAEGLMRGLLRAAGRAGAVREGATVAGLDRAGERVTGLRLADGRRIRCGAVVNAAGTRAAEIAAMAGIVLPVAAHKRHCFLVSCPEPVPQDMPLVTDPSGLWVRPEGRGVLTGAASEPDEPCDPDDFETDHARWEAFLWPALAHRIPQFERARVEGWWTGHYAMNALDHNAIVGLHPACANLYLANGFSGHGLQQAPGVGRGIAELILHGDYRSLDLTPLSPGRLVSGSPIREAAVI